MKMFNSLFKNKLDDRQLKIRGNIYFKSYTVFSFIIIGLFFTKELLGIDLMVGDWEYLIALFISVTYCFILMIYHEIYPLTQTRYRLLFIFFGLYGFGFFALYLFMIINGRPLFVDNKLSVLGCELIFVTFYIIIFVTYVIKVIYNHYHQDDDN